MSDKWIKYGPGCDIDPERYSPESENGDMYLRVDSPKILRALQQREERRKMVIDECRKHIITGPSLESIRGEIIDEAVGMLAIKILSILEETTDG